VNGRSFDQVMVPDHILPVLGSANLTVPPELFPVQRNLEAGHPTLCKSFFLGKSVLVNQSNSPVCLFSAGCTIGLRKHLVAHFVSKAEAL
jgi:hypothetical protein